jgi:hypothetical protein
LAPQHEKRLAAWCAENLQAYPSVVPEVEHAG